MTIEELYDELEVRAFTSDGDAEVLIQIGELQAPISGFTFVTEVPHVVGKCMILGDSKKPKLFL